MLEGAHSETPDEPLRVQHLSVPVRRQSTYPYDAPLRAQHLHQPRSRHREVPVLPCDRPQTLHTFVRLEGRRRGARTARRDSAC